MKHANCPACRPEKVKRHTIYIQENIKTEKGSFKRRSTKKGLLCENNCHLYFENVESTRKRPKYEIFHILSNEDYSKLRKRRKIPLSNIDLSKKTFDND